MQKIKILFAISLIIMAACTNDLQEQPDQTKEKKTMTISALPSEGDATRTSYEDDASGLEVKWTPGDAFKIYGNGVGDGEDVGERFELQELEAVIKGTFEGTAPSGADLYKAFYPAQSAGKTWADCMITTVGQVQKANGDMDHLSRFDYMTANVVEVDGSGTAAATFTHHMTVMKFVITLPDDVATRGDLKALTLSTDAEDFYVSIDADGDNKQKSNYVTLGLNEITLTDDEVLTAYLMMIPTTITGRIFVNVSCENKAYTFSSNTLTAKTYAPQMRYTATLGVNDMVEIGTGSTAASVFGDDIVAATEFGGGDGSPESPFLITNAKELKLLVDVIAGSDYANFNTKSYKLTTDIHVTATYWESIGGKFTYVPPTYKNAFEGRFDGGGHTVSGCLRMDPSAPLIYFGFFGCVREAVLENLHVAADVTTYDVTYTNYATRTCLGGIVGNQLNSPNSISNCTVSGNVTGGIVNADTDMLIGGIAGSSNSSIENCLVTGNITGNRSGNRCKIAGVGGIVGRLANTASVKGCVMRGNVKGGYSELDYAVTGGIAGVMSNGPKVHSSHNYGNVIAGEALTDKVYTGELVGNTNYPVALNTGYVYDCCTSIDINEVEVIGNGSITPCDESHPD